MTNEKINVDSVDTLIKVFGVYDDNIKAINEAFNTTVINSNGEYYLSGQAQDVSNAQEVIKLISDRIYSGDHIDSATVSYICDCIKQGNKDDLTQLLSGIVAVTARGKPIKCKTVKQRHYVESIKNNIISFSVGPAGTGKTYLAVALAVSAFKSKQVDKIILTRPAVEAGEKLGFLPGDLQEKVNPYLRPLYDALQEMFGIDTYFKLIEKGSIEIAPLAYMRGRTLSNAFIILDEAQNTTREQMKMFLTRLGETSKMVITGDITQIDLPEGKKSGLKQAVSILKDTKDIGITILTEKDVVRHPLISQIIKAYDRAEKPSNKGS